MKVAVAWGELQLVEEFLVIHDIQGIEDIEVVLFGLEECVLNGGHWSVLGGHIVQEVGRL